MKNIMQKQNKKRKKPYLNVVANEAEKRKKKQIYKG